MKRSIMKNSLSIRRQRMFSIGAGVLALFAVLLFWPVPDTNAQDSSGYTFYGRYTGNGNGTNGQKVQKGKKHRGAYSRGSTQAFLNRALKYYQNAEDSFWDNFDAEMEAADKSLK